MPASTEYIPGDHIQVIPSPPIEMESTVTLDGQRHLTGTLIDKKTREPMIGATVIASPGSNQNVLAALTDEKGQYLIELTAGTWKVSAYYEQSVSELVTIVVP